MKNRKRVFSFQGSGYSPSAPAQGYSVFSARSAAFSLVELLVVMAIIGTMVGLSVLAVQGMRAPAVQMAASQVMSGLSLARQVAITKNTQAAFLISTNTTSITGMPSDPFRFWSVVYLDRQLGSWRFFKDWEELPNGAFILETRGQSGASYSPINANPLDNDYSTGPVTPDQFDVDDFTITFDTTSLSESIPNIMFTSDGSASSAAVAIRIVSGAVISGNATLTSTNQYYFVETDTSIGRIRMRSPESYRNP